MKNEKANQDKSYKRKSHLSSYYKAAKPALKYKWCYAVLISLSVISTAASLAFAQNTRTLFDLAPNIPQDVVFKIILYFVVIFAVQYAAGFVRNCVSTYFNESVIYAMRRETLGKIQRLKMEFYDNNHTSKITNTFYSQVEVVKNFVVHDVRNLIQLPLSFIMIGGFLFTVHPYLGITAILASILQPLSNLMFKRSFFRAIDGQREVTNDVFMAMDEATKGIREIKINQIESFFDKKMKECQKKGVKYNLALVSYGTLRGLMKELPVNAGYIAGIALGITLMLGGQITSGGLVAFITLLDKVAEPFNGITEAYSNFQHSLRSANDLLKLVAEPEEDYASGEPLDQSIESIRYDKVSFSYKVSEADGDWDWIDKDNKEIYDALYSTNDEKIEMHVLEDVSFEIKGGSTVALVGPSGAGKSTIIKLLYKFYEPDKGNITINDKPLDDYNINSMRNAMSVVSQDIFIFDGTVRENLVLGRGDVTDKDIERALKYSESYDFVMDMPDGLDSYLGERGVKLSQGQKQRLSIARSIIKKASIIILDEPTSALDVETEYNFQQNLAEWAKDCTKFIIAHRLTTIRDADYILFLDNGRIIEQGSPYDLIKKESGKFKDYWEKQFLFQEKNEKNEIG